jgi:transposase
VTRAIEIISTVARRRRWTLEEKVEILEEAFRAGSSVAATSDRRGVSRALIYLWRRQAREGRIAGVGLAEPERPAFVPVHVAAITDQRCATPPTRKTRTPREQRPVGRIEVALTNGRIIKVDESIDPAALARLVAALDGGNP